MSDTKLVIAIHTVHVGDGKGGVIVNDPGKAFVVPSADYDDLIARDAVRDPTDEEMKAFDALDHDGDGKPGGSRASAKAAKAEKAAADAAAKAEADKAAADAAAKAEADKAEADKADADLI